MKKSVIFASALLLSLILSPCSGEAQTEVLFWTTEIEKDRLSVQNQIGRDFTARTGIGLRVIPVNENLLSERVTAAYAARALPDVIFHPIDFTVGWMEAGILDVRAATETLDRLGKETFAAAPLNLLAVQEGYAAVPMDGWGHPLKGLGNRCPRGGNATHRPQVHRPSLSRPVSLVCNLADAPHRIP